mgnify:CR=1 FL=1
MISVVQAHDPRIRPLPFPYKNAIAISNDPDFMSLECFEFLIPFLTDTQDVAHTLGNSLGLRIDSGYFAYSPDPSALALTRLTDRGISPKRDAARLIDHIQSERLSSIHTLGDHDFGSPPNRRITALSVETVLEAGGNFGIWTNHGNVRNTQCIGPGGEHHHGDDPESASYSTDLWIDPHSPQFYSSSHLATEETFLGTLRRLELYRQPRDLAFAAKESLKPTPPLIQPISLRDGRTIWGFPRVRATGTTAPNLSNLRRQVAHLDRAFRRSTFQAAILYQHLGVASKEKGIIERASPAYFESRPQTLHSLVYLSQLVHDRQVWNPNLRELLTYALLIRQLEVTMVEDAGRASLEIDVPESPWLKTGCFTVTFYDDDERIAGCTLNGKPTDFVRNELDQDARISVSVRLQL